MLTFVLPHLRFKALYTIRSVHGYSSRDKKSAMYLISRLTTHFCPSTCSGYRYRYVLKKPFTVFSVYQGAHGLEWRRPHEMVEDPRLFVGGGDRFDINQVRLLDFWREVNPRLIRCWSRYLLFISKSRYEFFRANTALQVLISVIFNLFISVLGIPGSAGSAIAQVFGSPGSGSFCQRYGSGSGFFPFLIKVLIRQK